MALVDLAEKEARAHQALQDLGVEIADRWASGFEKRPTQQLLLPHAQQHATSFTQQQFLSLQ
jgi:hypothetical protein